jgi:Flp pilus assembly pilin Flp
MIEKLFARLEAALAETESGQTMAEYAVVLAVITIAVVAVLAALSTAIQGRLNAVIGAL